MTELYRINHKLKIITVTTLILCLWMVSGCTVKPKPITIEEHQERIKNDKKILYAKQDPLTKPLTLSMAIARALKYNYDNRMAMMESVLQDKQIQLASLEMLPKLVASAGYSWRDNDMASFSVPVLDSDKKSGYFTTSQDRERNFADLTLSWNILDLGTSYYQAQQQADRFLIAQERQRKVINNIIRQVCDAYHRATTAERLMPKVNSSLTEAKQALTLNYQLEKERLKPLVQVLQYRKDLLTIIDKLNQLYHNLKMSKTGLAALINIPSNQDYQIYFEENPQFKPAQIKSSIAELEDLGLYFRHDIREKVYMTRIDRYEKIKQTINLFPGLTLSNSANYDSNSFLMNNNWVEMGIQTSLKLFDFIKGPKRLKVADARIMVDETSRLAMSVAVLVQINIAYQKYNQSLETYGVVTDLMDVENRLQKAVSDAASLKAQSDMDAIRQNAATIASVMSRDMAYTNSLTSLFELYVSLGIDFYNGPVDTIQLSELDNKIETGLNALHNGYLPSIPEIKKM